MSAKLGVDFLKQIADFMSKSKSFDSVLKQLRIVDGGEGRCVAEFTVGKEHLNQGGALHSGLIATIVDNVTTYALMSKPCHPGVSVEMKINHLKASLEGDQIVIDAKTVRHGKALAYLECELRRNSDNTILIRGSQTKFHDFG